jgi:AP-1-like factor
MEELEQRYTELRGKYDDLTKSYGSLQLEYSTLKQELEIQRRGTIMHERVSVPTRSYYSGPKEWEESFVETSNPFLFDVFDVSPFFYNQEEEGRPEETMG